MIRIFFGVLFLALSPGFVMTLVAILRTGIERYQDLQWFGGGAALFLILSPLLLRSRFWVIWEHEFTHMVVCFLTFNKMSSFEADDSSGLVRFRGLRAGHLLISIAPHSLPTFTLFVLAVGLLVKGEYFRWIEGLVGVTLAYHLLTHATGYVNTLRRHRSGAHTDFADDGAFICTCLIALGSLVFTGLVLTIIVNGYESVPSFFSGSIESGVNLVRSAVDGVLGLFGNESA